MYCLVEDRSIYVSHVTLCIFLVLGLLAYRTNEARRTAMSGYPSNHSRTVAINILVSSEIK